MANQQNTRTFTPTSGFQTITTAGPSSPSATLRLRAVEPSTETQISDSSRVRWAEDVIDNEGMGKKSSKVCCIYHKPHEPGDSDGDDSSDSDEDSEPDLSKARKAGDGKRPGRRRDHDCGKDGKGKGKEGERKPSPNAYERVPKQGGSKKDG